MAGLVPIVGRDHELEYLQAALGQAINGNSSAIFISGPLGIGKSRLLDEVRRMCKNLDCFHFSCTGLLTDRILLYPWLELADNIMASEWVSGTTRTHLMRFKKNAENADGQAPVNLADLSMAITSLIPHRAVVLLLDDIHCFDEASMGLLRDVVRQSRGSNVLLIATYETGIPDRSPFFEQTVSRLTEEGTISNLPLHDLDPDEIRWLIEKRLAAPVDNDLWEYVKTGSKGSPMHILETISLMQERKVLVERNGSMRRDHTAILDVPTDVIELAERRLERLDRDGQRMLEFRALLGPNADLDSLSQMTNIRLDKVIERLKGMNNGDGFLINERRFAFRHPAFEMAITNGISALRLKEMHKAIGMMLEKKEGTSVAPESLSYHLYYDDDSTTVRGHLRTAAEKCIAFSAHQTARDFLGKLMERVEPGDKEGIRWAHERLGDCNIGLGSYTQAHIWYDRCLSESPGPQERSRQLLKKERCLRAISPAAKGRPERTNLLEEAFSLGPIDEGVLGSLWLEKGMVLRDDGNAQHASIAFQQANHHFEASGKMHLLAEGLLEEIDLAMRMDDLERAYFRLMHLEELIDPDLDGAMKLRMDVTFGDLFMTEGYYECALRRYTDCVQDARKLGEYGLAAWCLFCQSLMYLDMTEFGAAADSAIECEEMAKLTNDEEQMILPKALLVLVNIVLERVSEASQGMVALASRRRSLPYPPPSIADGFVDLVDGILKYRQGQDSYGDVAFGQGVLNLSGMRMGSFFQGLGREWHGTMLLERGQKNKAREQFQLAYGIFLRLGNKNHSDRVGSHMFGIEHGWNLEQMAT